MRDTQAIEARKCAIERLSRAWVKIVTVISEMADSASLRMERQRLSWLRSVGPSEWTRVSHSILLKHERAVLPGDVLVARDVCLLSEDTGGGIEVQIVQRHISVPVIRRQRDITDGIPLISEGSLDHINAIVLFARRDDFVQPVFVIIERRLPEGLCLIKFLVIQMMNVRGLTKAHVD